jgi:hypothetical protein
VVIRGGWGLAGQELGRDGANTTKMGMGVSELIDSTFVQRARRSHAITKYWHLIC